MHAFAMLSRALAIVGAAFAGLLLVASTTAADTVEAADPAHPPRVRFLPNLKVGDLFPDTWRSLGPEEAGLRTWPVTHPANGGLRVESVTSTGAGGGLAPGDHSNGGVSGATATDDAALDLTASWTISPSSGGDYKISCAMVRFDGSGVASAISGIIVVDTSSTTGKIIRTFFGGGIISGSTTVFQSMEVESGGLPFDPRGHEMEISISSIPGAGPRSMTTKLRVPDLGIATSTTATLAAGQTFPTNLHIPLINGELSGYLSATDPIDVTSTLRFTVSTVTSTASAAGYYLENGAVVLVSETGTRRLFDDVFVVFPSGAILPASGTLSRFPFNNLVGVNLALARIPGPDATDVVVYTVLDEATFKRDVLPQAPAGTELVAFLTDAFRTDGAGFVLRAPEGKVAGGGCAFEREVPAPGTLWLLLALAAVAAVGRWGTASSLQSSVE